jgi:hypothetical protein
LRVDPADDVFDRRLLEAEIPESDLRRDVGDDGGGRDLVSTETRAANRAIRMYA